MGVKYSTGEPHGSLAEAEPVPRGGDNGRHLAWWCQALPARWTCASSSKPPSATTEPRATPALCLAMTSPSAGPAYDTPDGIKAAPNHLQVTSWGWALRRDDGDPLPGDSTPILGASPLTYSITNTPVTNTITTSSSSQSNPASHPLHRPTHPPHRPTCLLRPHQRSSRKGRPPNPQDAGQGPCH